MRKLYINKDYKKFINDNYKKITDNKKLVYNYCYICNKQLSNKYVYKRHLNCNSHLNKEYQYKIYNYISSMDFYLKKIKEYNEFKYDNSNFISHEEIDNYIKKKEKYDSTAQNIYESFFDDNKKHFVFPKNEKDKNILLKLSYLLYSELCLFIKIYKIQKKPSDDMDYEKFLNKDILDYYSNFSYEY